jgi:FR47-like protein
LAGRAVAMAVSELGCHGRDDQTVGVTVTTDRTQIAQLLDRLLVLDPVRHTVLGTILGVVQDGSGDPWCAFVPGTSALAVRSEPIRPVVLTSGWEDLDPLVSLVAELPALEGVSGPVDLTTAVANALERRTGRSAHRRATRLFRLDALVEPTVPGAARPATASDRALIVDWYVAFGREVHDEVAVSTDAVDRDVSTSRVWLWLDLNGAPASLATRRPPTAGSARIGPVYTPPGARGNGYASGVTAAATREVLQLGAVPVLFTELANPVSNSIYPRLGYRPVDDYLQVHLR